MRLENVKCLRINWYKSGICHEHNYKWSLALEQIAKCTTNITPASIHLHFIHAYTAYPLPNTYIVTSTVNFITWVLELKN